MHRVGLPPPAGAKRVHLDTEYYATMDDLPQEEIFRLTYCRDHILNALLNHRLAWPFINPIATQYLVRCAAARGSGGGGQGAWGGGTVWCS